MLSCPPPCLLKVSPLWWERREQEFEYRDEECAWWTVHRHGLGGVDWDERD